MGDFHLNETLGARRIISETIPCDSSFAEAYLQKLNEQSARKKAIDAGIADADAGKLVSLAAVRAKWPPR